MQPNKKYVRSDGVQYAMYPNPVMNITQSINGGYSHRGANAIDDAQQNSGISNGYAPCDMVCVATDYVNGNAMFWQSQRPVVTRKYGVCTICIMVIHDNTANAYVGMKIPQGMQLFSEGTAGHATGNHSHIEVKVSPFTQMYVLNGYGVYMMPGNVNPADVFFVDDTQIINGGGLDWGTIPSESVKPSEGDLVQEDGIATLTVDSVQARLNSPTGSVVRKYNTGDEIRYYWKWVGNGHRYIVWKEGTNYIYLAVSNSEQAGVEPWATFRAPDDDAPNPNNPFNPADLVQEDGVATFTVDSVRARLNDPNGKVVGTFNTGDKVRYYWKWVGNGHRYVVYKEGDDYVLIAISGSEEKGKDLWATFSAPDDLNPTPDPDPEPEPTPDPEPEDKPEFSDNPSDENFLENPDLENEIFVPKSKLFDKYGIKLVTQIVPKNLMPYKCPFVISKEFGVAHNAGTPNDPDALTLSKSMSRTKEEKSWHFSVDESTIVQNLPLNRNCWAQGDYTSGWKSKNGIAYEMCRDLDDINEEKFKLAERNAAILMAELMYQNGWGLDSIKKHQDFADKYCPHRTLDLGWDRYVDMVKQYLDEANEVVEEKPIEPEEPNKPSDDKIDAGLVNSLLKLLNKLIKNILKLFK